MGFDTVFDPHNWAAVPFHFWTLVFFAFGCIVGSFLNVCIYRMPLDLSVVSPPSHCPHCKYSIPFYLNIPLLTWLSLRGKCKNCGAPISPRYFAVELLTGLAFLACWLAFGQAAPAVALIYCLFLAGLITATFIDFEHFIIPDEITFGGAAVGFILSFFVPQLHGVISSTASLEEGLLGITVGAGIVWSVLEFGYLVFGRQQMKFSVPTTIVFAETALQFDGKELPYDDIFFDYCYRKFFFRKPKTVVFHASSLEFVDRCYWDVDVQLSSSVLAIGDEKFDPAAVLHMEAKCVEIVVPREAMGLGDVKFMAAIGAFIGWQGAVFSLMASSLIGSVVGVTLIVMRRSEWSSRIPYGPYIALAAAIWVFCGAKFLALFFR
jgi:leader peptidase (prepilin peptidase) / N-methyltransferase